MRKIFLIRHLKTESNINSWISGAREDQCINTEEKNKTNIADFLDIRDMCFYTTETVRTKSTIEKLCLNSNQFVIDSRLEEVDAGLYSSRSWKDFFNDFPDFKNKSMSEIRFPNGESYFELFQRVENFVEDTILNCQKNFLIVAHGGSIASILHILLDIPFDRFSCFEIDNFSISKLKKKRQASWIAEYVNRGI